jgi:type 2 lantibiotic biosynthesis protein LanM
MTPESKFFDLLSWIDSRSSLPEMFAPDCLVRDGYGWIEWIDGSPCRSQAGVRRFYRRAGAVLCILYALNFVDGHLENLIAMGEHPVVVDLETVAHPDAPSSDLPPSNKISEGRQNSVLRTGLLPEDGEEMVAKRMAGLDAPAGYLTGETRTFENPNTDRMELEYTPSGEQPGESLPLLDGTRVRPHEYANQIASGFETTYRLIESAVGELLAPDGPIEAFADADIRFVFRPTATYRAVLVPLTTPKVHRDARELDIRIERLARPFVMGRTADSLWPLHLAERIALNRGDIPRFTVPTDQTAVYYDGESVADVFDRSPLQQVRDRIRGFSSRDRHRQLDIIRTAYGQDSERECRDQRWIRHRRGSEVGNGAPSDAVLTDAALSVGRQVLSKLEANREVALDGCQAWYRRRATETGVQVTTLNDGVYDGTLGLAAFAAGLASVSGEDLPGRFAREVAAGVPEASNAAELATETSIGIDGGWGSRTYGFTLVGDLLDSSTFLERARANARRLVDVRGAADYGNDLISGRAGAILSLLALADRTGEEEWIDRAVRYGDDLLADRVSLDGRRVWKPDRDELSDDAAAVGVAHGISGIVLSLIRLYDATGLARFEEAASEAVEYERAKFATRRGNWQNSSPDLDDWLDSWCSGRAGIGVTRIEMRKLSRASGHLERLERAVEETPVELDEMDHLCCGNCSRVAFLQYAGRALDRPALVSRAAKVAVSAVDRAAKRGRFQVPDQTDWWYNPSLFRGEAGIAYCLLRLLDPDLPRVTVVE